MIALTGEVVEIRHLQEATFTAYLPKGGSLDHFLSTLSCALRLGPSACDYWIPGVGRQRFRPIRITTSETGNRKPAA